MKGKAFHLEVNCVSHLFDSEPYRITWLPSWPLRSFGSLQKNKKNTQLLRHLEHTGGRRRVCLNVHLCDGSPFHPALHEDPRALVFHGLPDNTHTQLQVGRCRPKISSSQQVWIQPITHFMSFVSWETWQAVEASVALKGNAGK